MIELPTEREALEAELLELRQVATKYGNSIQTCLDDLDTPACYDSIRCIIRSIRILIKFNSKTE